MDDLFYVPQSRFSLVEEEKLKAINELKLLAGSLETGVSLAKTSDNRFIFNFGHLEYDKDTLHKEYIRDLKKIWISTSRWIIIGAKQTLTILLWIGELQQVYFSTIG